MALQHNFDPVRVARLAATVDDATARRYEAHRWRHMTGGVTGSMSVGAFSYLLLAKPLAEVFRLTATQVTWISTIAWVAWFFTLPSGPFFDRFGPRATNALIFGIAALGFALMAIWFQLAADAGVDQGVRGETPLWRVVTVAISYTAMCLAVSFMDCPLMFAPMSVFPATKQDVMIATKPWMGLGSSVFAAWYIGFFNAKDGAYDMVRFFWFMAAMMVIIGGASIASISHMLPARADDATAAAAELRHMMHGSSTSGSTGESGVSTPPAEGATAGEGEAPRGPLMVRAEAPLADAATDDEVMRAHWIARRPAQFLNRLSWGMLIFSIVFMTAVGGSQSITRSMAEASGEAPPIPRSVSILMAVLAGLCVVQYWAVPLIVLKGPWSPVMPKGAEVAGRAAPPALLDADPDADSAAAAAKAPAPALRSRPERLRCDAWGESIRRPYFWTLYACIGLTFGGLAVLSTNFANMYAAMGTSCDDYESGLNATFVVVYAVFSSLGRIFCGALERQFPNMPPTAYLPLPATMMTCSLVATALLTGAGAPGVALVLPAAFHGLGDGTSWATIGLVVSNLFGPRTTGLHYSFFISSGMLLVPVFLQGLVAPLERAAKSASGQPEGDWCCVGFRCYGPASLAIAAACIGGAALGVVTHLLWLRGERQQIAAEAAAAEAPAELQEETAR